MKENINQTGWISMNASNTTPTTKATDSLIKKIDEQIEWYDNNSTRKEDNYIKAHLKLIRNLSENVESSEDIMFIDKIVGTFCEIIETQRGVISELEYIDTYSAGNIASPTTNLQTEEFVNDSQLQMAFTSYCLSKGKSSYTVNDYCSRVKNLWKSFYEEYKNGMLPEELIIDEEVIKHNFPLLNAYHHTDELNCYISMKISGYEGNRNWANIRAAFNKFDEFVNSFTEEK